MDEDGICLVVTFSWKIRELVDFDVFLGCSFSRIFNIRL